jgi:hypothetical protein
MHRPFVYSSRNFPGAVFSLKFAANARLDTSHDWGNTPRCAGALRWRSVRRTARRVPPIVGYRYQGESAKLRSHQVATAHHPVTDTSNMTIPRLIQRWSHPASSARYAWRIPADRADNAEALRPGVLLGMHYSCNVMRRRRNEVETRQEPNTHRRQVYLSMVRA